MDALRLLDAARAAGLAVALAGDKLIVRGPREAEPVVRLLAAHKPALLAILAEAADWQGRHAEARAHHGALHPEAEAAGIAWGEMQNCWYRLHGERVAEWRCAGCMAPIGGREALALGDGARVHLDTLDCLARYGRRWRGAATRALAATGLQPPANDDDEAAP
jgi:hypothetical protein